MTIKIDGRAIGSGQPPYVIAEMSGNHNGDINRALALIEAAKDAGADAVKLQTYTADTITIDHDGPGFTIEGGLWDGRRLHELYDGAHTPWDWHRALFEKGQETGITIFSSPFDETAIDFLEQLDCPAYKIASFEIVDLPLIERAAATGKPLIISTGMASRDEIAEAVAAARNGGCNDLVLLHCVSGYPSSIDEANLATLQDMAAQFGVPVGLSDHSPGIVAAVAATALGACVVEKHFTLSREDGGVDSSFSLEPQELKDLCSGTRAAWDALGVADYDLKPSEQGNLLFRRSLYVVRDIAAGEPFDKENVRSIRPGHGLAPKHLPQVLSSSAQDSIKRGTPLSWELVNKRT